MMLCFRKNHLQKYMLTFRCEDLRTSKEELGERSARLTKFKMDHLSATDGTYQWSCRPTPKTWFHKKPC